MITICVIGYLFVSLVIYYKYWKENFDWERYEWIGKESAKKGLWISFSVVPIVIFGLGVLCGAIVLVFLLLSVIVMWVVDGIAWILINMP